MSRRGVAVAVALVLTAVASSGVAAAVPTVESVAYAGDAAASTDDVVPLLWRSGEHAFEATVRTDDAGQYRVCVEATGDGGGPVELACDRISGGSGSTTVLIATGDWPSNRTGDAAVRVVVYPADDGASVASGTLEVTVLERDGDVDGDGLTNAREDRLGTAIRTADTDGDGLDDGLEVRVYGTEPTRTDTDGDGLSDSAEVTIHATDPTAADTDGDGLTDDLELGTYDTNPNRADTDGDGLDDDAEVNSYQTDPLTADTDGDGLPDGAEVNDHGTNPTTTDTDSDGVSDGVEVTVYGTDPLAADTDGDGLPDRREINATNTDPAVADTDGDGLSDGAEVTRHGTNPNRADTDGDGIRDDRELALGTDPVRPTPPDAVDRPPDVVRALRTPTGIGIAALLAAVAVIGVLVRFTGVTLPTTALRRLGSRDDGGSEADGADGRDGANEARKPGEPTEVSGPVGTTSPPTGPAAPGPDDVPPEAYAPLTNEERVVQALEANGGRMQQSDLVDATAWSKAKVSRVLSSMEAAGKVRKIDLGNTNLVALPGREPDRFRSSPVDRE